MKDQTHTARKSNPLLKVLEMVVALPVCMFALVFLPAVSSIAYLYSKAIRNPKERIEGFLYLSQKALTDERYQAHFADFLIASEMPQPLNIERNYLLERRSKINMLHSSISGTLSAATSAERSLWTAGELKNYAHRHRLNTLHYIGGLDHTTEIAYFLQNPDFSFERLEDYRRNRR